MLFAVAASLPAISVRDTGGLPPVAAPPGTTDGRWLIPAGRDAAILELLAGLDSELLVIEGIDVQSGRIVARIRNAQGAEVASVTISHASGSPSAAAVTNTQFADAVDEQTERALVAWTGDIETRDGSDVWVYSPSQRLVGSGGRADDRSSMPSGTRPADTKPGRLRAALGVVPGVHLAVCLLAILAGLVVYRRGKRIVVTRRVKITHALPTALQTTLFAYWLAHWPDGRILIVLIAVQLAYAYVFDFLFSVVREPRWQAGLGPVPVVLSTNLFAQFIGDAYWCSFLAVAVGLAAKTFVLRDGKHIFNPSVIGLTVVAVIELASPSIGSPDFGHEFDAPPNMTELILMLALIVQLRLPVVLVTLGAALGILATNRVVPDAAFNPAWAAVTLVLCLLITDPATIPRSEKGKLLFGLFVGSGMVVGHNLLIAAGYSDFWAKLAAVPLANLLVPAFNRGADLLPGIPGLSPRFAKVHVALWLALCLTLLSVGKRETFLFGDAADYTSPCYVARMAPHSCEDNPMYCRLFSFPAELRCWWNVVRSS